jgi:hypothetical protein
MTLEIPTLIWPESDGCYKIIQIENLDQQPFLRFGIASGKNGDLHRQMLKRFAKEIGVDCIKVQVSEYLLPALPEDCGFRFVGAGYCDYCPVPKEARFHGDSYDYKIGIDRQHISCLQKLFDEWTFYPRG